MKDILAASERKFREYTNPYLSKYRRNKLNNTNFSIISNNCWAGSVYRYYGLPYQSPTVGLYFFAKDYVRFVYHLRYYLQQKLEFISIEESCHADSLVRRGEEDKILARLSDIEIVFLHYSSVTEAEDKWYRRSSRINWDNIFIKFSQMNECSQQELYDFDALHFKNKICLTAIRNPHIECGVYFPGWEKDNQIYNDTDKFNHGFNLTNWLNSVPMTYFDEGSN